MPVKKNDTLVALLISTYNSSDYLKIVLRSILAQTVMPSEIVIAEDGEDLVTEHLIQNFKGLHNLPITHIRHHDLGFRKSLILNKAVRCIQSDYIIEIDGDVALHRSFIEDHLNARRKGTFVQGSRVLVGKEKTIQLLQSVSFCTINCFSSGIKNRLNAIRCLLLSKLYAKKISKKLKARGCNLAYWKSDYIKINGYNNEFIGWGYEDTDFSCRMMNAGVNKVLLKFSGICYHLDHPIYPKDNVTHNSKLLNESFNSKSFYSINGYVEATDIL